MFIQEHWSALHLEEDTDSRVMHIIICLLINIAIFTEVLEFLYGLLCESLFPQLQYSHQWGTVINLDTEALDEELCKLRKSSNSMIQYHYRYIEGNIEVTNLLISEGRLS